MAADDPNLKVKSRSALAGGDFRMARFLVTYHGGNMPHDPESLAKARDAFLQWARKAGSALAEPDRGRYRVVDDQFRRYLQTFALPPAMAAVADLATVLAVAATPFYALSVGQESAMVQLVAASPANREALLGIFASWDWTY